MKNKTQIFPQIALAVLILVTLACGTSSNGVKVGEATPASNSAPVQAQIYKIGDIVQVGDSTITLNSATLQGGKLSANFTIENKGTTDMAVSSMMSFSAKNSEGTKLDQEFGCGSGLDGKVLPNDKLKGDICWNGVTTNTVKIYYEAGLFSSGAVVWEITQ